RVGEDGPVPAHEAVEAAQLAHQLVPRPEEEMVGVRQHDLSAGGADVGGREALHRAERGHRHEGGRVDGAVGGAEATSARGAVDGQELEAECAHRAYTISMASPYE